MIQVLPPHLYYQKLMAHAEMWLNKSLKHELSLRGVEQHSEFQFWHNYLNLTKPYGYCLTVMGFLNFEFADPVKR